MNSIEANREADVEERNEYPALTVQLLPPTMGRKEEPEQVRQLEEDFGLVHFFRFLCELKEHFFMQVLVADVGAAEDLEGPSDSGLYNSQVFQSRTEKLKQVLQVNCCFFILKMFLFGQNRTSENNKRKGVLDRLLLWASGRILVSDSAPEEDDTLERRFMT